MKRIVTLLVLGLLLMGPVACSQEKPAEQAPAVAPAEQAPAAPAANETAVPANATVAPANATHQ